MAKVLLKDYLAAKRDFAAIKARKEVKVGKGLAVGVRKGSKSLRTAPGRTKMKKRTPCARRGLK